MGYPPDTIHPCVAQLDTHTCSYTSRSLELAGQSAPSSFLRQFTKDDAVSHQDSAAAGEEEGAAAHLRALALALAG